MFLVRHKKGDLLWDTGLPADIVSDKPTVNGNFTLSMGKTLPTQLAEIGLKPADIEFVTVSHGHFDHSGQVGSFPSATWLVHKKEVEANVVLTGHSARLRLRLRVATAHNNA